MTKFYLILSFSLLAACQAGDVPIKSANASAFVEASATDTPAMDSTADVNHATMPATVPVLNEMIFANAPKGCRLAKPAELEAASGELDYVFTSNQDPAMDSSYFQVAVDGKIRTLKTTYEENIDARKIRYLRSIDTPILDVFVETENLITPAGDIRQKGLVSRIKAWDEEMPILCHYAMIPVQGNCDL